MCKAVAHQIRQARIVHRTPLTGIGNRYWQDGQQDHEYSLPSLSHTQLAEEPARIWARWITVNKNRSEARSSQIHIARRLCTPICSGPISARTFASHGPMLASPFSSNFVLYLYNRCECEYNLASDYQTK